MINGTTSKLLVNHCMYVVCAAHYSNTFLKTKLRALSLNTRGLNGTRKVRYIISR